MTEPSYRKWNTLLAALNIACLVWFGYLGHKIQAGMAARETADHDLRLIEKRQAFYREAGLLQSQANKTDAALQEARFSLAAYWKQVADRGGSASVEDWSRIASISRDLGEQLRQASREYFAFRRTFDELASRLTPNEWDQFSACDDAVREWSARTQEAAYAIWMTAFAMRSSVNFERVGQNLGVRESEAPQTAMAYVRKVFLDTEQGRGWTIPYREAVGILVEGNKIAK